MQGSPVFTLNNRSLLPLCSSWMFIFGSSENVEINLFFWNPNFTLAVKEVLEIVIQANRVLLLFPER